MSYNFGDVFPYLIKKSGNDVIFNRSLFTDNIQNLEDFFNCMLKDGFDGSIVIPAFEGIHWKTKEQKKFPEITLILQVVESGLSADNEIEDIFYYHNEVSFYDNSNNNKKTYSFEAYQTSSEVHFVNDIQIIEHRSPFVVL